MPFTQRQFFKTIGYVFLLWAATNTYFGMVRYGWDEGMYWWFCNLCLGSMGAVLVFDHWGWGLGWISVALATQTFWITDNFWRIFTGKNLFGLVEFMYQPGNPFEEFLISHYHFYILPVGITYLFVTKGEIHLNETRVGEGDQARIENESSLKINAVTGADFILLDLPVS